jgi:hypothetical protein
MHSPRRFPVPWALLMQSYHCSLFLWCGNVATHVLLLQLNCIQSRAPSGHQKMRVPLSQPNASDCFLATNSLMNDSMVGIVRKLREHSPIPLDNSMIISTSDFNFFQKIGFNIIDTHQRAKTNRTRTTFLKVKSKRVEVEQIFKKNNRTSRTLNENWLIELS